MNFDVIISFARAAGILLIVLVTIILYGIVFLQMLRIKGKTLLYPIIGFYIMMFIFNLFCLPLVLMKQRFTLVYIISLVIWTLSFPVCFWTLNRQKYSLKSFFEGIKEESHFKPYVIICAGLFLLLFYYCVRIPSYGFDATTYMKYVSDALVHDTMYRMWPENGTGFLPLKYAVQTYFMLLAVFSRAGGISASLGARFIGGGLCAILGLCVIYLLSEEIFRDNRKAWLVTVFWVLFNFIRTTIYTPAAFLMERAYEGKAWCGNVLLPFILYLYFHMWNECDFKEKEKFWWLIFLASWVTDAVSMSALISAPLLCTVLSIFLWFKDRRGKTILYWFLCMIPFGIYAILYLLNKKGWFAI